MNYQLLFLRLVNAFIFEVGTSICIAYRGSTQLTAHKCMSSMNRIDISFKPGN